MQERADIITMKGTPLTLVGDVPIIDQAAPDFTVVANNLAPVSLADFRQKIVVIVSVPSLDTSVCDIETRRFNQEAAALGDAVRILVISMDLPFAQQRWCGAAGIERVQTLSDHRDASFGLAYGVLIKELRLLARAIFIVDQHGYLRYRQIVPEVANEPDYAAVLQQLAQLQ